MCSSFLGIGVWEYQAKQGKQHNTINYHLQRISRTMKGAGWCALYDSHLKDCSLLGQADVHSMVVIWEIDWSLFLIGYVLHLAQFWAPPKFFCAEYIAIESCQRLLEATIIVFQAFWRMVSFCAWGKMQLRYLNIKDDEKKNVVKVYVCCFWFSGFPLLQRRMVWDRVKCHSYSLSRFLERFW